MSSFRSFETKVRNKVAKLPPERATNVGAGQGVYLQIGKVKPDAAGHGAKGLTAGRTASWVFRFRDRATGKLRETGIGSYEDVTLAEARDRAADLRKQLRDGTDPIAARREARAAAAAAAAKEVTFDTAAARYIEAHKDGWRNQKHHQQWKSTIATYCTPAIGKLPVAHVELAHVMDILEPLWATKPETASRLRGRIEAILDWSTVRGYREGPNPARWRGHLEHLLKSRGELAGAGHAKAKVRHHPALPYAQIGAFMKTLCTQPGLAAKALELVILTACRTSEVINARWSEFDLKAATWSIPAERMKAGRAHVVPLGERAVEILKDLQAERGADKLFVFANKPGQPLSNMALLALLKRMGRADITTHGFRSTFRDWAAECTIHDRDTVELALAHAITSKVESAYRRGDLLEKRRRLMADWARRCSTEDTAAGNVVPLRA